MTAATKLCLPVLLFAASSAAAPPSPGGRTPILIKMVNLSTLPPGTLAKGAAVAREIYARIGVETEWLDCTAAPGETAADSRCAAPVLALDIVTRILPKKLARRFRLPKPALGAAMLPPEGFGYLANAFSHRVDEIAHWTGADPITILGHILAHEVGHVLLSQPLHAKEGLMQAAWREDQLRRASGRSLQFTQTEVARLRLNIAARAAEIQGAQNTP